MATTKTSTGTSTLDQSVMVNKKSPYSMGSSTATPVTTPKMTPVPTTKPAASSSSAGFQFDPKSPQYSPSTGIGTQAQGYTYTQTGWKPTPVTKTGGTGTGTGGGYTGGSSKTPGSTGMSSPLAEPTIGEATGQVRGVYDPGEDPYASQTAYWKSQMDQNADPAQIYQQKLAQWQGYMDALKGVYAQKVDEVRLQGQGRLGTNRASQARGGLLGSDFGSAQSNTINDATEKQVDSVNEELDMKIKYLMGEIDKDASAEYQAKRDAINQGTDKYTEFITMGQERKKAQLSKAAQYLLGIGITDVSQMNKDDVKTMATKIGVPESDITYAFNLEKSSRQAAADKAAQEAQFSLSEGQARYDGSGKVIASRAKTYAPGTGSGGSGYGSTTSPAAQNILNLMNTNGGTVDDYVKGSSKESQRLRNEVYAALSGQGGMTQKSVGILQDAKSIVDSMVQNKDYKKFGYSAKLGGQYTQGYGDMQARAKTVNAILARDNLGLLKGAMSDKDVAFIEAMSGGVPSGVISESYAKERINSISEKLTQRINGTQFGSTSTPTQTNQTQSEVAPVYTLNGKDYSLGADGKYYPVN